MNIQKIAACFLMAAASLSAQKVIYVKSYPLNNRFRYNPNCPLKELDVAFRVFFKTEFDYMGNTSVIDHYEFSVDGANYSTFYAFIKFKQIDYGFITDLIQCDSFKIGFMNGLINTGNEYCENIDYNSVMFAKWNTVGSSFDVSQIVTIDGKATEKTIFKCQIVFDEWKWLRIEDIFGNCLAVIMIGNESGKYCKLLGRRVALDDKNVFSDELIRNIFGMVLDLDRSSLFGRRTKP